MNILILGSGGREHAISWKLAQSKKISRIYIAPGNSGTDRIGTNLKINPEAFNEIREAVVRHHIGMVIVGPEAPLVGGIHDFFLNDGILKDIPVIGPVMSAARLEGSKTFAKEFLKRHNIPTAQFRSFDRGNLSEANAFLRSLDPPYVIKADGLAAGKGVVIVSSIGEAEKELNAMINGKFGVAGQKVVIEQYLRGIELSAFIVTDGKSYKLLPEAKDYKRIGEGDTGPNTGGMGAVSPVPFADRVFMEKVKERIIDPTIKGLIKEGIEYKGFIFFGLINVDGDPYMIEYNARLGDPETEAILPRIKSDLFELVEGVAQGNLEDRSIEIDESFVATVMLVSGGYPDSYGKGYEISGLEQVQDCVVFHAGSKNDGDRVVTSGGRVLAISANGETLQEALTNAYRSARLITFRDLYYRKDIGYDL